jgi:DNA-binding MarR family transcriptional regulator
MLEGDLSQAETSTAPLQPHDGELHVVRRLRRAFLSICRCGDIIFSPYRLTTEQYALMRAVQRQPGIRQTDLQDRIFAEPNTITAMVSLLERRNILRRKPSSIDKRVRQLFLTAHGQTVMYRLSQQWGPMREILHTHFASSDGQRTLEILDAVAETMLSEREKLLQVPSSHPLAEIQLADVKPVEPPENSLGTAAKASRVRTRSRA